MNGHHNPHPVNNRSGPRDRSFVLVDVQGRPASKQEAVEKLLIDFSEKFSVEPASSRLDQLNGCQENPYREILIFIEKSECYDSMATPRKDKMS